MKTLCFYTASLTGKKSWTALLLCCIFATQAMAQQIDIFGGINPSGIRHQIDGNRQDASGKIGYHFGLSVFVPFNAKKYDSDNGGYGFFPALQYIKKGTVKSTILGPSVADIKIGFLQLNLPLSYTSGMYGIGIGPYVGYAVSGQKKYRVGNGATEKIDFGNELKRIDYGIGIHMNISIFRIQYELGLANLATGNNGTAKTRSLSLSLDIPIMQ
ncbi:outer membrane beta-barrel protein [Edaphocola aurantiacus]|uniref:outer membrane beta-barrel protein n=1 Tax=Edaphocola aurantiacus TaxID=2601682 RepID=UPI001C956D85|nr:outer membrane beta-barrel protein [Edaphocola aurantiacus]